MTCKDCIHYELCDVQAFNGFNKNFEPEKDWKHCGVFKDKSKYIELPCKVGDTVYVLNRGNRPQKMILDAPDIRCHCSDEDNLCMVLCADKKHNICTYRLMNDGSDIGKTVFLTKSEAEQKLKGLQNEM